MPHSDKNRMKPLDYTLYNKVKKKFPAELGKVFFVSLKPENLEELNASVFTIDQIEALWTMTGEHARNATPFAALGGFSLNEFTYDFCCSEFEQEEDLNTGKITRLSVGTYNNNPTDIEALKRDLQKLKAGIWSEGNS